jgi:hypothetical protein
MVDRKWSPVPQPCQPTTQANRVRLNSAAPAKPRRCAVLYWSQAMLARPSPLAFVNRIHPYLVTCLSLLPNEIAASITSWLSSVPS